MQSQIIRLAAILACTFPMVAQAVPTTIRENLAGSSGGTYTYWGQSVSTGPGTAWNNLEINFYSGLGPVSWGDIYLLSAEYAGTPAGLPDLDTILGVGADTGDRWTFDPSTTIFANTTYWFYTASQGGVVGGASSGVEGEGHYIAFYGPNFTGPHAGINFTLTGEVVARVPEPSTFALFCLGLLGLGFVRRTS
jgi:hypothetical protein